MSTDRRDLDEKTGASAGGEDFDREINVRGILWTGLGLVLLALAVQVLMWWLLRGFSSFDEKRDVRLTPIEVANPQQPPPEPRLQVSPNDDMAKMREKEDDELQHGAWVNRQQGTVRLPIDVAMDAIAARGVASQVVGGTGVAAPPAPTQPAAAEPMARPPAP